MRRFYLLDYKVFIYDILKYKTTPSIIAIDMPNKKILRRVFVNKQKPYREAYQIQKNRFTLIMPEKERVYILRSINKNYAKILQSHTILNPSIVICQIENIF